ncbi:MAG TPA: dihydroxy-acid dehydratase, partial [Aquabacterium sp.]|nr:dihydroxy-acid dehydratase [Aquabacterium sp.]
SGKVPAAIHVTPEALNGGPLGKVRDGDLIVLDAPNGLLQVLVPDDEWHSRAIDSANMSHHQNGMGRNLFAGMRHRVTGAEQGATTFGFPEPAHTS